MPIRKIKKQVIGRRIIGICGIVVIGGRCVTVGGGTVTGGTGACGNVFAFAVGHRCGVEQATDCGRGGRVGAQCDGGGSGHVDHGVEWGNHGAESGTHGQEGQVILK